MEKTTEISGSNRAEASEVEAVDADARVAVMLERDEIEAWLCDGIGLDKSLLHDACESALRIDVLAVQRSEDQRVWLEAFLPLLPESKREAYREQIRIVTASTPDGPKVCEGCGSDGSGYGGLRRGFCFDCDESSTEDQPTGTIFDLDVYRERLEKIATGYREDSPIHQVYTTIAAELKTLIDSCQAQYAPHDGCVNVRVRRELAEWGLPRWEPDKCVELRAALNRAANQTQKD